MQLEIKNHKAYSKFTSVPNGKGRRTWLKDALPYFFPRVVFNLFLPFNFQRNGFRPSEHMRKLHI